MEASMWKVLAVDDDPEMLEGLERILSSKMGEYRFEFTCADTFNEGLELLHNNRFDLVFLDVHEERQDPAPSVDPNAEDQRGEELLQALKSSRFVPVVFYTGFPAKVDHLKSHVVKVVDKGSTTDEVRAAVKLIMDTGLPQLARYIEERSRAYIWDNLEFALKRVADDNVASDIALLAARNLSQNLSQKSVKELLGMDTSRIAPLEMYLFPPVVESCNPADIFRRKKDDTTWIVLTPACDFEQHKAENVLLASVTPLVNHRLYKQWVENNVELANVDPALQSKDPKNEFSVAQRKVKEARGFVKSLILNKLGGRYKFLPGTFFLRDSIVDFQQLLNLPVNESDQYEIICSLDNPYREEIVQLFSNYYGRIGTPDYDSTPIWEKIDSDFVAE